MNVELLYFIQRFQNPVFDLLFELCSLLAEQVVLALIFCYVYWCRDKKLGRYLIVSLGLSLCVNGLVKDLVRAPRPIGQPGIVSRRIGNASGYSFPSNHAQSAASFYGAAAIQKRKPSLVAGLSLIVLLVGFSRLYLGLHYPVDVLGGWLIGLMLSFLIYLMLRLPGSRILLVVLCGVLAVWAMLIGESSDTIGAGGLTIGLLLGLGLEEKYVHFAATREPGRALARLFGGFALIGAVYLVPALLLARSPGLDAARYGLIAFLATGGWPWLFTRLESGWIRRPVP